MKKIVHRSDDKCEVFKKRKIVDSLMDEIGLKEYEAMKIARSVEREIKKFDEEAITSSQIRAMVQDKLIRRGFIGESRQYERVGIPVSELKEMIRSHDKENANMSKNPETIHKHAADKAMKQFSLICLPDDIAKAHDSGDVHLHDLEYFPARSLNCLQHDLRFFIENGLRVDGTGEHTSAAGPANNVETLVNHSGQILMASQVCMSGGQSLPLFNVFMAPYIKGLPYDRVKQAIQMFIFNLNMSYTSRGGQAVFSSVNLEFGVPKFLENEPAWGPGGKIVGVYGDYHEEVKILQRAFTEVLYAGDSLGKPHLFPNTIYGLRKEFMKSEYDEDLLKVHELSAKYSVPYFSNQMTKYSGESADVMGCRTRLNSNWTGDWEKDTIRTGNLAYVSLNLPRLSYRGDIYEEAEKVLSIAEQALLIRREHSLKLLNKYKLLGFLTQEGSDGEPYYRIENATLSFGAVGLNEMLLAEGIEGGISSKEGMKEGLKFMEFINEYAKDLTSETGYRFTVLQTPGETTAHRFATLDKSRFEDAIVNGGNGSHYYTNSTHIPVDNDMTLFGRIKREAQFHPLTSGGAIMHAYIGEAAPDPAVLMKLTKRIAERTEAGFWAYSGAFSFCFGCNSYMKGLRENCPTCGEIDNIEHYDRVTGYIQAVGRKKNATGGWNAGKRAELKDRYRYQV